MLYLGLSHFFVELGVQSTAPATKMKARHPKFCTCHMELSRVSQKETLSKRRPSKMDVASLKNKHEALIKRDLGKRQIMANPLLYHILCEPAQSKGMWTSHKGTLVPEFIVTGQMEHLDLTPAL